MAEVGALRKLKLAWTTWGPACVCRKGANSEGLTWCEHSVDVRISFSITFVSFPGNLRRLRIPAMV